MAQDSIIPLSGTVEIDETYVGGKKKFGPHAVNQRVGKRLPHPFTDKAPVVALVQRGGRVYSRHVPKVTADNLKEVINETVAENSHVMTDSGTVLYGALMGRKHDQVNHTAGEYVRYKKGVQITTNSVEGFFATLKRGINGVYHHVSKEHLHRYLAEFDFRYNYRKVKDTERSLAAIKRVSGKRLKYWDTKPEEKF